jgi:phosphate ABC transporter phosphate-binding protein
VLADIFLGTITNWNNGTIAAMNPGVTLPNAAIAVVHRADGSGTTFVWTSYLHVASTTWPSSLVGKNPNWPTGIGKPQNAGVAGYIKQNANTIGYVELAYTVQNSMTVAKVRNPAGNFILPTLNTTKAAAEGAAPVLPSPDGDWSGVSILNAAGANSYPISSLTYLLLYKELNVLGPSMTKAKAQALVDFVWWAVHDLVAGKPAGQSYSAALLYVPLPQSVVDLDVAGLQKITYNGQTLHI